MNEGWEIKKLSEVAEYFNGLTYSPKDVSEKGIIVLRSSNIQNDELEFSDIVRVEAKIKEKLFVKEGDILMCSRNGSQRLVGKTAPILNIKEPMTFGTFMMIIRSEIGPYLLYFFKTDEFKKQISGGENTMINQVTRYMLDGISLPIPPLQEQEQIVAILDEAFAAIDQAKANIEKNIQNARELFQSKMNEIFSQKGEGWEIKPLSNVCSILNGYAFKSKDTVEKSNTQVLRMGNLYQNKLDLDRNPVFYPEHFKNNHKDFLLKDGDLVMSLTGTVDKTDYGYTVKIKCSGRNLLLNQRIMKIDVKDGEIMNKDYLRNFLLSPEFLVKLYSTASGTRQANLSSSAIMKLNINFPKDTGIQEKIVSIIDTLSEKTIEVESLYRNKLNQLEELKKSLLHKAFSGELKLQKVDAA